MESVQNYDINRYHKVPVVMLDYSGSVSCNFSKAIKIFEKLVLLLKDVAVHDNFDLVNLIMWSSTGKYMGQTKVSDIDGTALYLSEPISSGATNLYAGLKMIPNDIYNNIPGIENEIIPIYVFTDGDINEEEGKLSEKIREMNQIGKKLKYDLRMIVLESNDTDYLINDCTSGNTLVRIVRQNNLRDFIKYILFFNRLYDTFDHKFINLYTTMLPEDYVQYDDKCFHIKNYALFLAHISNEINKIKTQIAVTEAVCQKNQFNENDDIQEEEEHEAEAEAEPDDDDHKPVKRAVNHDCNHTDTTIKANMGLLEKIGYNLIKAIRDLERINNKNNSKKFNKRHLIDFFCNLIGFEKITEFMKRELMYGVDNKTFQEYRERRGKLFSTTQFNMYSDLKESISPPSTVHYTSFIEHDIHSNSNNNNQPLIYLIETEDIEYSINIGIREYKHAGIYDFESKRLVPIVPISDQFSIKNRQAMRQWVRAIYSKRYGIPASSDLIHYTFLIDNMYVQCSDDLPQSIKDAYNEVTFIMMDRVRYGQAVKEYVYLSKGEEPKPVGSNEDFWAFLQNCPNYPRLNPMLSEEVNLSLHGPIHVWDCILRSMNHPKLKSLQYHQKPHTSTSHNDGMDWMDMIKGSNLDKIPILKKISLMNNVIPNYYCFITMSDTDETGGFMFYPHKSIQNNTTTTCRPKYVMSQEACDGAKLNHIENGIALRCPHCMTEIDVSKMIQTKSKEEYEKQSDVIARTKESKRIYKNVEIYDEFSDELIKLDELDFSNNYRHRVHFKEHLVLGSMMDSYSVIKLDLNNKQQVFNEKVPKFLLEVDMTNVVIAGGMCRSILLGQKIQDIDMFFVGLTEDEVKQRLIPLINDVVAALQKEDSDYRFIMMHKPINSVVEILCTKSTFDESEIDDEMDNKITLSEKYLFSQNEVIHKVQIILKAHRDIKHIFDDFDMHSTCVAFDGVNTVFNEASYIAFKYMVNMIDPTKARHTAYNHRVLKYHKYGFSIGLYKKMFTQELLHQLENSPKVIKISGCVFELTDQTGLSNNVKTINNYEDSNGDDINEAASQIESIVRYSPIESFKLEYKNKKPYSNSNGSNKSYNKTTKTPMNRSMDRSMDQPMYESYHGEPENGPMYESYQGNPKNGPMYESYQGNQKNGPMYKSHDELSSSMAGLYNYISDNDIRYCYLFGKINEDSIYEVMDIENIKFLKRNRDDTYNWYSSEQIQIVS